MWRSSYSVTEKLEDFKLILIYKGSLFTLLVTQKQMKALSEIPAQGIKFRINNRFIYASFM